MRVCAVTQAVQQPGFRLKRKCSFLRAPAWAVNTGGHETSQAVGSDCLAGFLAKNAHEPPQELLHKPQSALYLVLTGQNRDRKSVVEGKSVDLGGRRII